MRECGREVNGVRVGRAERTTLVAIDSNRLKTELNKRGLSMAEASKKLLRSKTYFANIVNQNGVTRLAIEQIESILGIPPEAYLLEPEAEQKPEADPAQEKVAPPADLERVEWQLTRIADALEVLASVPTVTLTRVERCTLLLKQMLCYGTCLFNDFEKKAEAYGFTSEEIKESVRLAGAAKELKNGTDMYLRLKK